MSDERKRQAENCVLFGHIGRPGTECTRCHVMVPGPGSHEAALREILKMHQSTEGVHSQGHKPVCGSCGVDDGWYTVLFPCDTYSMAAAALGIEVPA